MNRYAYLTTNLAIKAITELSSAKFHIHGQNNIPKGSLIFTINHFTRVETFFLPYQIYKATNTPVWSLADYSLFKGGLGNFLENLGAVSTKDPDRDMLMVKTLLTGEASWVIYPEGRMVKTKQVFDKVKKNKPNYMIAHSGGYHPPHTGAASLALRTEFYRQRIKLMNETYHYETKRLLSKFNIDSVEKILCDPVYIIPVNITYYPIRARENIISNFVKNFIDGIKKRTIEELMTEGTMFLSGVDIDIRFGEPINISQYMKSSVIKKDIASKNRINFDDPIASKKMMKFASKNIMDRYMSSIYNRTTVNHDHLFASILINTPLNKITETDFKQKVFLAATTINFEKEAINRHTSLLDNQIHLLTDDRYKKYENFISLAIEKGVVKKQGNYIIKTDLLTTPPKFHKARIENPVAVIANESESLFNLHEKLIKIAHYSKIRTKHLIYKELYNKSMLDFEKNYKLYYNENESKSKISGKPFVIQGDSTSVGVVLIHGYLAAPIEVKKLALYLNKMGFWVSVPRLPGHGTSHHDLAERSYIDWIESVEEAYIMLKNRCDKIVTGGFSTGAGIALEIASRIVDIKGVFAISPPMKLMDNKIVFAPALNLWNKVMGKIKIGHIKKEFIENRPENPEINYLRNPVSGVIELEKLMDNLRSKLSAITLPALIIQAKDDPVVDIKGTWQLFQQLGSVNKEFFIYNFDRHGILLGKDSERIYRAVGSFIKRIT